MSESYAEDVDALGEEVIAAVAKASPDADSPEFVNEVIEGLKEREDQ